MRGKMYLFGDSITEESFTKAGWGASLAHHFSRSLDIVVRGYSGYNTRWALKVIDRVFPTPENAGEEVAAVTVFFGANDACLTDRCSAFQNVPKHEYAQNLNTIVSFFKNRWPKACILLITPPPIDEVGRLRHPYMENLSNEPERTNEAAGAYAQECVEVAEKCGVPVINLWNIMQGYPDWQNACLRDGLHLAEIGNQIVFDEVIKKLSENGLSLETLPVDLPLISEIDQKDPLKSFQ